MTTKEAIEEIVRFGLTDGSAPEKVREACELAIEALKAYKPAKSLCVICAMKNECSHENCVLG